MSSREHTAARGHATTGKLVFTRGAGELRMRAEKDPGRLFTARFQGRQPAVTVTHATVTIRYPYAALQSPGEITLNPTMTWAIRVHGDAHNLDAQLIDVPLASLRIARGASAMTLRLSEPDGWVPIHIGGGVSNVTIRRPSPVAARLQVKRGAAHLTLDDQCFGALGGRIRLESSSQDGTANGYDIYIASGANQLTVTTG